MKERIRVNRDLSHHNLMPMMMMTSMAMTMPGPIPGAGYVVSSVMRHAA